MRVSGPWEAGEGNGRHRDAERGGGSVHMTLSVAHADIPIAVVTLATTSHGAAQAERRLAALAFTHLLRPVLPQTWGFCAASAAGRAQARRLITGRAASPPAAAVQGQEMGIAMGQQDGPWG